MHILRNAYTAQTVYHTTKSTVCIKTVFKISNTLFSTFLDAFLLNAQEKRLRNSEGAVFTSRNPQRRRKEMRRRGREELCQRDCERPTVKSRQRAQNSMKEDWRKKKHRLKGLITAPYFCDICCTTKVRWVYLGKVGCCPLTRHPPRRKGRHVANQVARRFFAVCGKLTLLTFYLRFACYTSGSWQRKRCTNVS